MNRRRACALLAGLVSVVSLAAVVSCGSGKDSGIANAKLPDGVRDESIDHESCSESGNRVETLDANNDSKYDVKIIYAGKSTTKVCLISDLNHDGRPDMFEYYDKAGELRRREADYDDNGTVDAIEDYRGGKLVERELDTTGQHRIDTWELFDGSGKLVRRERDTTNDGRIDQWATFDDKHQTIAFDKNGDGKPDPNDTVVLNLDGTAVEDDPTANPSTAAADGGVAPSRAGPTLASPLDQGLDAGADGGKARAASTKKATKKTTKDGGK